MARLAISLFGAFSASLDGAPLTTFKSGKVRALLAYLAVEAGIAHSRSVLADLLWPEQGEERARRSLSQALYNLRYVLGERNALQGEHASHAATLLTISPDTIQLSPSVDDWVDVLEFNRLVQACDQHPHRSIEICATCEERLQVMVGLYRGEFLEGIEVRDSAPFEEWVLLRREGYRQDVRRAFASLAACHERQGHTREALQAARRLFELDPYDDSACAGLVRLLAASGQRSEALAVYERFRSSLRIDLNLEPAAETRRLYTCLRSQKEAQAASFSRRNNLPASLSPLIGREVELREVQERLLDPNCRLLTILGLGGTGKSRLALEAARGLLGRFGDDVYLALLSPLVSPESLLPAIAAALGLHIQARKGVLIQLQDYLRSKELLLVLDGCEGLLDGVPLFVELLHSAPYLKMLATSRLRLNVAKEEVYPLGGLQYASYADPQAAAHCAAVSLFASGARRTRPDFELSDHNLRAVSEITAHVQGMPLAILLAAAWVEVLSPAEILAEMGNNLDFLHTEWADLPPRQRSMRLTFDYSWNLLDEDERRAFQALCVFRGAFTRQAAQAVSGAGASELRRLVDKSLLMPMPGEWFSLHELLRQYGMEKLEENPDESARVHRLHSVHYLQKLAEWEQGLKGTHQVETLALMDAKINDLRLAWELACLRDEVKHLDRELEGLCLFYEQSTRLAEGRSLCQETVSMLAQSHAPSESLFLGHLLIWQSRFSRLLGEHALADQLLEKCQALVDSLASSTLDVRRLHAMIYLEAAEKVFFSELAEAEHLLQASLDLFRSAGDAWHVAGVLCRLGVNRGFVGDFSESDRLLGEAIELYQSLGCVLGIASARRTMAQNQVRLGKLESGLTLMRQVIADSQTSGNRAQVALDQRTLGVVLGWNGLYSEALLLFQESLAVADDLGDLYEKTFITLFLAAIDLFTGQYETSSQLIARSLDLAQHNGFEREAAFCLWVQGGIEIAENSPQAARPYYLESIKTYRQVGHQDELCWALALDAFCLLQLGENGEATRRLGEALEIALSIHGYMSALFALLGCALRLRLQGDLEVALELFSLAAEQTVFAGSAWFADVFGQIKAACTADLEPEVAEFARQRGMQRSIWDSVTEMQVRLLR